MEIKSGTRTKAKSLAVYKEKYKPEKTIKLISGQKGSYSVDIVHPLYDLESILVNL